TDEDEATTETSAGPATETSSDATSDTEGSESASTTGETIGEGCNCSTTENTPWGATGTLLALGFTGFVRRRRFMS
ncbi:MAG: MYXO-CTERM sorting domain-containing protein, partial [Nannocystaceae bacterium]